MQRPFSKVFCIGLSRTGTTSLCLALERLGLRSIHWPIHLFTQSEALGLPPFCPAQRLGLRASWRRSKELKASRAHHDAHRILETHDAFGDLPVPLFYRELDAMYPGAKFLMTTRPLEKWLSSMRWLLDDGSAVWRHGHLVDELHCRVYGTTRYDRAALAAAFLGHEKGVRAHFLGRESDCLWLPVEEGALRYEALADFLGINPQGLSGPCPRANEAMPVGSVQKTLHRLGAVFPWKALWRRVARQGAR